MVTIRFCNPSRRCRAAAPTSSAGTARGPNWSAGSWPARWSGGTSTATPSGAPSPRAGSRRLRPGCRSARN